MVPARVCAIRRAVSGDARDRASAKAEGGRRLAVAHRQKVMQTDRERSAFSACCRRHYSETKLVFPAVRHWRLQSPTCSHNFLPPTHPQKAPTGHILILCCAFYLHPPPTSLPFPFCCLRPPPSSACFSLWNGALLNHTALLACSLFHSSFFVPPLSLWLEAYLRGSAAGRLSTENPGPQQQEQQNK